MKTLWLTYNLENDNSVYATLFEGGDVTEKKNGEMVFKNFKEIQPTIDDINIIIDTFTKAKKQMESVE